MGVFPKPSLDRSNEYPPITIARLKVVPPEKFTNFLNAHKLHRARQGLLLEIASRMPFQRAGEIIRMFSEVFWGIAMRVKKWGKTRIHPDPCEQ